MTSLNLTMNIILACLICALKSASVFADLYSEADEVNGNALSEQQQHMLNGDCPFTADHGSIIKTNESLTNNAVFIEFHKGKSREECLRGCCELENCNLAVYEKKEEHNCYLFNCGREAISRCHFSHHEDYMTMTLTPTRPHSQTSKAPQTVQDQHEDELEGLADKKQELPSSPKVVKSTPVPSRSTTTTTSSPQNNQNAEAYGVVYGECAEGRYCSDNNAECIEGICVCKHGFHYRHGACKTAPSGNHNKPKSSSQGRKPHKSHVSDPSSVNVGPAVDRRPVSTTRSTTVATTTITATTSAAQKMVTTTQSAPTPTPSATEIASSPSKANDTEEHAEKSPSMKKNREGVEVEQIIIASPTDSAQGPIVALALGLAFTIMLLFFVGCRLRTVKRRIRKGRPLHSNEADYLINGMYL